MKLPKTEFMITQKGPIELTGNMGGDPAFKVAIQLDSNYAGLTKVFKNVTEIYYHASMGWVPIVDDDESSVSEVLGRWEENFNGLLDKDSLADRLSLAIDRCGNRALGNLFRVGESMWDLMKNQSFLPASVDNDEVDSVFGGVEKELFDESGKLKDSE